MLERSQQKKKTQKELQEQKENEIEAYSILLEQLCLYVFVVVVVVVVVTIVMSCCSLLCIGQSIWMTCNKILAPIHIYKTEWIVGSSYISEVGIGVGVGHVDVLGCHHLSRRVVREEERKGGGSTSLHDLTRRN